MIVVFTVSISGCTVNPNTNGTWGEKKLSLDKITVTSNTTGEPFEYKDQTYYGIWGYLENKNDYDAYNVRLEAYAYDAEGNLIATNNTPLFDSPSIPAQGITGFYVDFLDPEKKIVRFEIKIISASAYR